MTRRLLVTAGLALVMAPTALAQTPPGVDAPEYTEASTTVSGVVPATLSLTLGPAATFGAFAPGVSADYSASTTGVVTSSAGDATLSVADRSDVANGHLVNGAFSLRAALRAKASSPAGLGTAFAEVGPATPLLSYSGPVTGDTVTFDFVQTIAADEPLRTGTYGKTLTFTLATTTP